MISPEGLPAKLTRRLGSVAKAELTCLCERKRHPALMMRSHVLVQVLRPLEKILAACTVVRKIITRCSQLSNGFPGTVPDQLQQLLAIWLGQDVLSQGL